MFPKKKLNEIATIYNGNSINKTVKEQKYMKDVPGWNYIGTKDVDFDGSITYKTGVIIPFTETKFRTAPVGTVFVCSEGGSAGKKTAIVKEEVCFGNKLFAIVNKDNQFSPKYLYYYTRYGAFLDQFRVLASTLMGGISTKNFGNIEVPFPKLEEQELIVSEIEGLFSSLDNAAGTLKKTKELLAVYRQAVLKEAFEGRLTKEWRITNNKSYGWKVVSIVDIVKKEKNALKAGPFGSSLKKECYVPDGYKIYGQEQVIAGDETIGDYYVDYEKYLELITCKVAPNDVLISLVGTVGKVLVLSKNCKEGIINPRLIKVSLDENAMLPYFFKYYFESGYLRTLYKEKAHGETMDVLNLGMIKELPFWWCPIDEQQQVIKEIESRMTMCDNIEQTVDRALQETKALYQSVLKEAFEGRLV